MIERGAAEGWHPACWYLWLSARLMRGCAFVGACACRHRCRMFHVKQCEDDGRFESRRGRVSRLEPGLRRLLGWCAALLVLPAGRLVRLLGVE